MKLTLMLLLTLAGSVLAADFWLEKEPAQWSEKEIERLLTKSPWAKQVTAAMDFSRMGGPGMPGGPPGGGMPGGGPPGGGMGGGMPGGGPPGGGMGGPPGMGGPGGGMPEFKATVRWESAEPLRAVAKRALAGQAVESYVISITGLPMNGNRGSEEQAARRREMLADLKNSTNLKGKGKNQLNPSSIQVDESTGTIFFIFTKDSEVVSEETKELFFTTRVGPLEFRAKFSPKEMKYKGQIAL